MYVDDEVAITIRDMAVSKADIDIATKTYETARAEVMKYMLAHDCDTLTTDEYMVKMRNRTTLTIDRKELEKREPELFRELATINNAKVIIITPR